MLESVELMCPSIFRHNSQLYRFFIRSPAGTKSHRSQSIELFRSITQSNRFADQNELIYDRRHSITDSHATSNTRTRAIHTRPIQSSVNSNQFVLLGKWIRIDRVSINIRIRCTQSDSMWLVHYTNVCLLRSTFTAHWCTIQTLFDRSHASPSPATAYRRLGLTR